MSLPIAPGTSVAAIGLSGMRAAERTVDTSAHNIANAQTPGFRRQTVTQTAQPGLGGVAAQVGREPEAASPATAPFGDLAEDLVTQRMGLYSFAANLRTVQTEDRMLGALLDIRA